jgi:NADPH:quinone reductase-like Zn-dependent oxidoreductase
MHRPVAMKAIRIHAFGGPEVLSYEEAPEPRVGVDDVLVRVRAAGVNPIDVHLREGQLKNALPRSFPMIVGWDVAGVVVDRGTRVSRFTVGDEVYGRTDFGRDGCYAERVAVRAIELAKKPRAMDDVAAAAVPVTGLTAWQALFEASNGMKGATLRAGDTVLIHGAAGGVGTFAVQLAKWRGARVVATCSTEQVDYVRSLGADEVVDHTRVPFEDVVRDVDVVVDLVGGDTQRRSWRVVRKGGVLVSTVSEPSAADAAAREARGIFVSVQPSALQLDELATLIDAGVIRAEVSHVLPLEAAREAHTLAEKGHARGKIVLKV